MIITRKWAMPTANTFQCPPIRSFVEKYLEKSKISIDPFARNSNLCSITNDINPNTVSQYHMDAIDFINSINKSIDLVLFDPPYSLEQLKRSYNDIGRMFTMRDGQICNRWTELKNIIKDKIKLNGIVLSFGWNSIGMGKKRGFEIEEILLVCHGGVHNDTICIAEQKLVMQGRLAI